MKQSLIATLALLLGITASAQRKTYQVDIDMFGRQTAEVTEPDFLHWEFPKDQQDVSFSPEEGVTFRLFANNNMRSSYYKGGITPNPEKNARLLLDGVYFDPVTTADTICLGIKGLPAGQHNIQTIHNSWDDAAKFAVWPVTITYNQQTIHKAIAPTQRIVEIGSACILETPFTVTSQDEEVVIMISTNAEEVPADAETKANKMITPLLNGFIIDGTSAAMQAKDPMPEHNDLHVDADNGSLTLTWLTAGEDVTTHTLYFGTDSTEVADSNTPLQTGSQTSYTLTGLTNANTYYWRVDETFKDGTVAPGKVWRFRPRHLAFPGAEGYGRHAQGGRYGEVVYVTNLNSDGPGSYREAVKKGGKPRTILFNVSGVIDLGLMKEFTDNNITIAGQSAPGKGICLAHSDMGMGNDVIVRHMRFRRGWHADNHGNAMGVTGSNHTIADHISTSWGTDETVSGRNAKNATFQYSMISEALGIGHGFAATIGGEIGSYHHNFLVNCSGRNWSMGGGLIDGYYGGRLDLFNNVCYNWWKRATDGGAHEVNFVGNYYKMGPDTNKKYIMVLQLEGVGKGTQSVYMHDNIREDYSGKKNPDKFGETYTYEVTGNQVLDWTPFVEEPFFPSYATIHSAEDAYKIVLSNMGANQPVLDDHDKRNVQECLNRTWTYMGSPKVKGQIDKETDAGGFELYPETTWPEDYDTDLDGLPNWFETIKGTNPQSAKGDFTDSNSDPDGDGYTLLEDYLDFLANPHLMLSPGQTATIDMQEQFMGFTASPQYSIEGTADNAEMTLTGNTLTVSAKTRGLAYVKMKVADSEGSTYERQLAIAVADGLAATNIDPIGNSPLKSYRLIALDGKVVEKGKANNLTATQLPLAGKQHHGVFILETTDTNGKTNTCKVVIK